MQHKPFYIKAAIFRLMLFHRWAYTFLLFVLMAKAVNAGGQLSGRVTGNGEVLESASVALLKTDLNTLTDSLGNFTLQNIPNGTYQLRVSFIGYENFQEEIRIGDNNTPLSINLTPLTAKLTEAVITGSLREVERLNAITPTEVYNKKYLQQNPTSNLFDALNNMNGVFADIDNGVSNTVDVQLNGLEGNYTMFLIDGVPAFNGPAGLYALNALPTSVIDKIEIVRGASSTLYGSEAIAGVINIKTIQPQNAPKFTANVWLSSYAELNSDFTLGYKLGRATSLLTVSTENFNTRWDIDKDGFTDIPLHNRLQVFNKWSIEGKKANVATAYVRYLYSDRFGGEKNMPTSWRGSSKNYGEAVTTHQWQWGIQLKLPTTEDILINIDHNGNHQNAYYGNQQYTAWYSNVFAQVKWDKQLDRINHLMIGSAYRMQYYSDNTVLSQPEETGYGKFAHNPGLFIENELKLGTQHNLLLGVRADYSSRSGPAISPRINYKWNSRQNNHIVRIGVSSGYRMPSVFNEGIAAMNGSRKIEVPEKLKAENAISANASYTRVQDLPGGLLHLEGNIFYTYLFNFVNADYDDDPTLIVYRNSKGATATGFNLNSDLTFNFPLKLGIGVTYAYVFEVEENDEGEMERERTLHQPDFTANFYLTYRFPAPGISVSWTGNLISPMLLSTLPNDYRPERSPWYTIQNISFTKQFKGGFELYAGIKNLFNFIQKDPIMRPFDPFNLQIGINNPNNYRFDTTYGFTATRGISGFAGFRYVLQ